ncbi:ATP-binding protein [Aporhodopirellula aestuarii]|uniref:ATP-binding protein n=1 Tax=Aporhodopirellula aestuarii TaxID=2950107 RepID=A0ABT0TWQ8_9BACT|nr:ATP-binding protein [Aporhodopirellula aestuarii]MCM2368995.1 ATP-binding protein [Aporhodopirellula aestuarii]
MQTLTVSCPQGHQLHAPLRAIGKTLPCPICKEMVAVSECGPIAKASETKPATVMRKDSVESNAQRSISRPHMQPAEKRDPLSDTGVMRILGDFVAPTQEIEPDNTQNVRTCPLCSCDVSEAVSVCKNCKCYIGPSPDFFKQFAE